jgi:hypothetical protein
MQAQPNDAKEARPMQVAGGLADRQCGKSSGGLPCLPSFTDSLSHTVQLVYTSSGPYDTQSFLKVFVDHNPQPVLTTFINIDECAVSSADHLLCAHFPSRFSLSLPPLCSDTLVLPWARARLQAPSSLKTSHLHPVAAS